LCICLQPKNKCFVFSDKTENAILGRSGTNLGPGNGNDVLISAGEFARDLHNFTSQQETLVTKLIVSYLAGNGKLAGFDRLHIREKQRKTNLIKISLAGNMGSTGGRQTVSLRQSKMFLSKMFSLDILAFVLPALLFRSVTSGLRRPPPLTCAVDHAATFAVNAALVASP